MLIDQKQAYLAALIFSSVLAWASFFSIIFFVSPQSAGALGIVVLYSAFTIGFVSLALFMWQFNK